jgi:lysophospholipase L1-like esterase
MNIRTVFLWALACNSIALAAAHTHWVVTWGASPSPQREESQMRQDKLAFDNQTIREIIHTSIGADTVRVRLSNAFGKDTVEIGAAHIALTAKQSEIVPGSDHVLTFGGRPTASIPPNAILVSDPVKLNIPSAHNVTISLFLPKATLGGGIHYSAQQTAYVGQGDLSGAASIPNAATVESWVFLSDLDVLAPERAATLVAFGDSITDGARSATDANHRWPNFLSDRLRARRGASEIGVLDAGIGGNRVLHDAISNIRFGVNGLARFDRDVLAQPGTKYVIVLEGINDLGHAGTSAPASETVSAEDLIVGLEQMADRAHENGFEVFGATLTPFEGAANGYFTPEKETKRKAINEWIRTGKAFDGVIDFDKALRDSNHPDRMAAAYDSGDHLHPNDAGYKAMADAIDLSLFK